MAAGTARRSGTIVLGVSAVLASAVLTGCSPSGDVIDADYAQVCQDVKTGQRAEDAHCSDAGRAGGHYGWYFFPMGSSDTTAARSIPAVGSPLTGGTTTVPQGATTKSGVTPKGSSTVSRGGFGSSAKGGSIGG